MDPIVLFLKEDILPGEKLEADKNGGKPLVSGYSRTRNCTNAHFLGYTCIQYILRYQNYFLRSYIKGFMEATLEVDRYPIEPSLKAIGGQTCRKKHKNM